MTDDLTLACLVPYAPEPSLATCANRAINGLPDQAVVHHLLSLVQAGTNDWAPLNPVLSNGHSLKRTLSNPLCLPESLISKHMPLQSDTSDPARLSFEPRLVGHHSQAARTEILPIVPPGQAMTLPQYIRKYNKHTNAITVIMLINTTN